MSMRSAASCCQDRQESAVPRGARTVRTALAVVTSPTSACRRRRPSGPWRGRCPCLPRDDAEAAAVGRAVRAGEGPALPEPLEAAEEEEERRCEARRGTASGAARASRRPAPRGRPPAPGAGRRRARVRGGRGRAWHLLQRTAGATRPRPGPRPSAGGGRGPRSPGRGRGPARGPATCSRTRDRTASSGSEERSGRRNSRASQAARSSTASTRPVLATTRAAFHAAVGPMETWSSLPAEVGIESTLAGWARTLFSEARAAAVTCAIMSPECSPPSRARKAGRPERDGFTSRSVRRSLIAARSATAIASEVGGDRHRLAVEVAAGQDLARLREDHRVVGGRVHLDLVDAGHVAERVPGGAVHLRHAAQAVGVLDAAAVAVRLAHGAAGEQGLEVSRGGGLPGVRRGPRGCAGRTPRRCPRARRA